MPRRSRVGYVGQVGHAAKVGTFTVVRNPYQRNFGAAPVCALNASLEDQKLAGSGDPLSSEWSKVRSRPNLTNCFDSERENGCGNF